MRTILTGFHGNSGSRLFSKFDQAIAGRLGDIQGKVILHLEAGPFLSRADESRVSVDVARRFQIGVSGVPAALLGCSEHEAFSSYYGGLSLAHSRLVAEGEAANGVDSQQYPSLSKLVASRGDSIRVVYERPPAEAFLQSHIINLTIEYLSGQLLIEEPQIEMALTTVHRQWQAMAREIELRDDAVLRASNDDDNNHLIVAGANHFRGRQETQCFDAELMMRYPLHCWLDAGQPDVKNSRQWLLNSLAILPFFEGYLEEKGSSAAIELFQSDFEVGQVRELWSALSRKEEDTAKAILFD